MSDIKHLLNIVGRYSEEQTAIAVQDSFDIELGEDQLIETGIVDINEDGILVEGDEETLALLEQHGLILEETNWSKYDEPTISRITKGVTQPLDRTDYDVPPAMRDPMQGKPGYEKRRSNIMKGIQARDKVIKNIDSNPVYNAITRRILLNHLDLFTKYNVEQVKNAIQNVADSVGPVEEIGSSDVSHYVNEVINYLKLSLKENTEVKNKKELIKKIKHFFASQLADPEFQKAFIKGMDRLDVERVLGTDSTTIKKDLMRHDDSNKQLSFDFTKDVALGETVPNNSPKNLKLLRKKFDKNENDNLHAELEESKISAAALMSLLSLAGINSQALAYTDPTKSVEELARENPKVKELLVKINALGQKPASDLAAEKWRKQQDQMKPATAGQDEKIPLPSQGKMNETGPGDEPVYPEKHADDKRWDDAEGEEETVDEAKYQGREVPLGKPMAGDVKKSKVYVRKPNGKVVKVNFGDKKMRIKKSNPKRRKSFRARHNCKNPGPRWKARYWSCRAW